MVNNSTNINKTKESLKSAGLQFHQYQQSKRKFKEWGCTIRPISTNQDSLKSDGQQFHQFKKNREILNSDCEHFHQYQQNKRNFKQWWSTIPQISKKQKKA